MEHGGEDNTVKHDIVFANKVDELGVFIFPIRFPVYVIFFSPFFGCGDISNWRVKPYIQDFVFTSWHRYRNPPIEISCHCSCLESIVEPRFDLAIVSSELLISLRFAVLVFEKYMSHPSVSSFGVRCLPRKPVAPVTKTFNQSPQA